MFWALSEARRRHAPVLLLHAPDGADAEIASVTDVATTARAAAVLLQARRRHARRLAPDVETHAVVGDTDAVHALVTASRRANLLVVGYRVPTAAAQVALGSVGQRVAAHAHCAVVLVPQASSRLVIRRVAVVGADVADVDFAAAEAERWAAVLALLTGNDDAAVRAAERVRERHPSVLIERYRAPEDNTSAVVGEARRADLVVLGCRHVDTEFDYRFEPLPLAVLTHAGCPVVLVGHAQ